MGDACGSRPEERVADHDADELMVGTLLDLAGGWIDSVAASTSCWC